MLFLCALCVMVVSVMGGAAHAADVVERRGDDPPVRGQVLEVSDEGVWVRSEGGASRWISWDRVRRIEAASNLVQENAENYQELAQDLWRARTRVERGDTVMAEPIFESYFDRYRGQENETALVVAEGLLRCYLAREARVLGVVPALEVARLRSAGVTTVSYSLLPPVLDESTLLCPALPPVWTGSLGHSALERQLREYESEGNEVIAAIAALYRRSVERELRQHESRTATARLSIPRHPGAEFLRDAVASVDSGAEGQRAARVRLERRLNEGDLAEWGPWAEAWARYHIGRSLLDERSLAMRQRGLLQLVHLPARHGASQPYLAGLALAQLSAWHEAGQDHEAAASLREELARRYPAHPALQEQITLEPGGSIVDERSEDS